MLKLAATAALQEFTNKEVFRISGNEFVIICKNILHEEFIRKCNISKRFFESTYVDALSIGITWADADIHPEEMVSNAKNIMQLSKQKYYRKAESTGVRSRPELLERLQADIRDGHFKVYLQPKAKIEDGSIVGAEALVRRIDPEVGIIPPGKFIPDLEKENIVSYLDFFILEETLKIMQKWQDEGKKLIPVSVNYSRSTLIDPNALSQTVAIFNSYSVSMDWLEIEVTESIGNVERATIVSACEQFAACGFKLALDDFGSAYSSLAVLSAINFDVLKIDKSVINDIVSNPTSQIITKNVIQICTDMGIKSVAEGVETEEQLEKLREFGCEQAQGYFFNKPIPPEDFEKKYML